MNNPVMFIDPSGHYNIPMSIEMAGAYAVEAYLIGTGQKKKAAEEKKEIADEKNGKEEIIQREMTTSEKKLLEQYNEGKLPLSVKMYFDEVIRPKVEDDIGEFYALKDERYLRLVEHVRTVNIDQFKKDFALGILPILIGYENNTGIPAEITFGQICTESKYGQKSIEDKYTKKIANNFFGFKGVGTAGSVISDTEEIINGKSVIIEDEFRAYNNIEESIDDYAKLMLNRYSDYLTTGTIEDWAKALDKGGYASAPNYGDYILGVSRYWRVFE